MCILNADLQQSYECTFVQLLELVLVLHLLPPVTEHLVSALHKFEAEGFFNTMCPIADLCAKNQNRVHKVHLLSSLAIPGQSMKPVSVFSPTPLLTISL